ncbi:MAG: signal peptidase II [Planctomycetota bacterium]|nr:signal peptidase II [Planctomycetota bacterium]
MSTVQEAAPAPAPAAEPGSSRAQAADERPSLGTLAWRGVWVVLLIIADLWSKAAAFVVLEDPATHLLRSCPHGHRRLHLLGPDTGWLTFMRSENRGAAFGKFADYPHLLVGGRILAVLFLVWLLVRIPARRRWFGVAMVLVLAGALGNLYDNLFLERHSGETFGWVRDFIDVYFARWEWHFPTFNLADSCITVGAVLLLLSGLEGDEAAPATGGASSLSPPPR